MATGDDNIHVESISAMQSFSRIASDFHHDLMTLVDGIERRVADHLDTLRSRFHDAEDHLRDCEAGLGDDDNQESSGDSAAYEEALARYEAARSKYETAEAIASRVESALHHLRDTTSTANSMSRFLERKSELLTIFTHLAAGLDKSRIDADDRRRQPEKPVAPSCDDITSAPLPPGFKWIPLSEVCFDDVMSAPLPFTKVSPAELSRGAALFREKVLPLLVESKGQLKNHDFARLDQEAGQTYTGGLQQAYEVFLAGSDYIYLCRAAGVEKYEIVNGRHRIRTALDLGWPAIPAQTKDLNSELPRFNK